MQVSLDNNTCIWLLFFYKIKHLTVLINYRTMGIANFVDAEHDVNLAVLLLRQKLRKGDISDSVY